MNPKLIKGGNHADLRGRISFNNEFDASAVKRIYTIENESTTFVRAWQGHRVERRWFSVVQGSFEIKLIKIDQWEYPNKKAEATTYILKHETLDILCVPKGYVSSIQSLEEKSKLLVMSDYLLEEVNDEYRYPKDYFV